MLWDISYFLQASDVYMLSPGRPGAMQRTNCRSYHRNDWICWVTCREPQELLWSTAKYTCLYVHMQICSMSSLGAASQTYCTWFMLWNTFAIGTELDCLLSPSGTVLFFHGLQPGRLWLQNLNPRSALHRTGIPRDFTITVIICTVEFSGFFSIQLWIK